MAAIKTSEDMMEKLFDELVPCSGKADTKAGEIVRAYTRINYRFFNDGDHVGIGYGKETCNPAARFLAKETNNEIADLVASLSGCYSDKAYEVILGELEEAVLMHLAKHPELKETDTTDMWDYRDPNEDVDDENEEEW